MDDDALRDAIQETFLDAWRQRRSDGWGAEDLPPYRLLCCIAWRKVRGEVRRKACRVEVFGWNGTPSTPAGQLYGTALAQLARLVAEAVRRHGHQQDGQLLLALEHKLLTGEPDREVAHRFGIPREYLNRAKRFVQDGLLQWC
ncbi:MAG: hypothetical protein ABMA64_06555 [Myxococcota bacterium]